MAVVRGGPEPERILVVDDRPSSLVALRRTLAAAGYEVYVAGAAADALRLLASTDVDLVITEVSLPHVNGLSLARYVRENLKDTEVLAMASNPSVAGAVEAVKVGAEDYLPNPPCDYTLLATVGQCLERVRRRRALRPAAASTARSAHGLLGQSEAMRGVVRTIAKAASTAATVLISGASGTGKELVARAIHYASARAAAPFVPVNCAAIPEGLLESELFGHLKGAFTGATESRAGFFQTADGGTIFLDEIGETSPAMQVKLMRVLQDREICMVGATRTRKVDVRIVAATNRDPATLVAQGGLREDLFYRLNVIAIALPPLRERRDDIPLLARHFAARFAAELGKPIAELSEAALQALCEYYWPGNVRELENVVQSLVVMSDGGAVEVSDLPPTMRHSVPREAGLDRTLAEVELEHIRNVLSRCHGNRSHAATILGIDRKTLRAKLRESPDS